MAMVCQGPRLSSQDDWIVNDSYLDGAAIDLDFDLVRGGLTDRRGRQRRGQLTSHTGVGEAGRTESIRCQQKKADSVIDELMVLLGQTSARRGGMKRSAPWLRLCLRLCLWLCEWWGVEEEGRGADEVQHHAALHLQPLHRQGCTLYIHTRVSGLAYTRNTHKW